MIKKKWFYSIVVFVAVLLLGLIAAQIYWIKDAYRLKEISFNQKVDRVLNRVVTDAEEFTFSFYMYGRTYIQPGEGVMMLKTNYHTKVVTDTVNLFNAFPYTTHPWDSCFYATNISYYDNLTIADVSVRFESRRHDSTTDASVKNEELKELSLANLRQTLDDTTHITKRMNMHRMDSVLNAVLKEEQVPYECAYGFRKKGTDEFEYVSKEGIQKELSLSSYKTYLFSDITFATPYELVLLPDNKDDAGQSIVGALSLSILIIVLLIASFIYFIYTVLAQKKLSEMKTDFINNMTHEFMTPITNIGLALETLDKEYDKEVLHVIDNENAHLRDNVNKVLQVALLEKGSYYLDKTEVDIHSVLERVARSFSIQIQEKGGTLRFIPGTTNATVIADETHIINLFYNIVDNCVKYAGEQPLLIEITTSREKNKLRVQIKDNGKGMDASVRKMIFEKFYRAQKGNRHDVKGFGLGLTYVKSIADAHNISIEVDSTPDVGTSFLFKI